MRRFQYQEGRGERGNHNCVLLYCGDHDPIGLKMSENLMDNLVELSGAVGWSPEGLTIERFGLNADFIERHGLTWVDNLETSSGGDLADPGHKWHNHRFVQDYISEFGARKCEANALVVRPDAGRDLCRKTIEKYLDLDAIPAYEEWLKEQRDEVEQELPKALKRALRER
jgi:hypothetical protein